MKNKQEIIEIARSWIDTPWHHNQRKKGIGVDCINFLADIAFNAEYYIPPIPIRYAKLAKSTEIESYLDNYFVQKEDNNIEIADILLFRFGGYNTHVGLATSENAIIHASAEHGRVLEHPFDGVWCRMLKRVWKFEKKE